MTNQSRALASLGEFGWLKHLLPKLYWPPSLHSQLWIGPGDDAGVLGITRRKSLVATTDTMVEGVHFDRRWGRWESLGEKIISVNLSDLAAMGDVKPLAALVTAGFPGGIPVGLVDKLYKGMHKCAKRWKTGFLGGDTVGSPRGIFLSVTLLGEADPRTLIRREGARAGDWLATTGPLGLAGAGLEVLQSKQTHLSWTRPLLQSFLHPQPRFKAGALLGRHVWATSMMDCSDGLAASAKLLAEASATGMKIDVTRLPKVPALERWAQRQRREASAYALYGGEDYELIFTLAPARWAAVHRALPRAAVIGEVRPKAEGCWTEDGARRRPLEGYGYAHFAKK
jgi:thiamine-monophosphate kinase